ncbi:MAG TPA: stimulus-sensing domain-containing protein [Stellaceae bacterium]|nr:stimulus-sensing domain-containing protein [Stellaceae bacterium]
MRSPGPLRRPRYRLSPLTLRILAINVVALGLLGGGFFYLGQYQQNLVYAQTEALKTQGQIFAAALGAGAVDVSAGGVDLLNLQKSREMMRRLVEPTHIRARLFDEHGTLVGDSRSLGIEGQSIQIAELPPPVQGNFFVRLAHTLYGIVFGHIPWSGNYAPYRESATPTAADYPEVGRAFQGILGTAVRRAPTGGGLIMTAAVPVQYYKQVLGVVLLSSGSSEIEDAVRAVRFSIAELFLLALGVTVLLSIYLAGTIVRPLRQLAAAAEQVRRGQGTGPAIPNFAARSDEIGDLSLALREMTETIRHRMNAIEHFAADVAHELKNPLTSLRSAVETALRVDDPEKRKRLWALVIDDANRLDRLITDISDASRLDAELSRDELSVVPLGSMLRALVALYRDMATPDSPFLVLDLPGSGVQDAALHVRGNEERLVRVFRNLLDNAISFSPPSGTITLRARRTGDIVRIAVEDEGPGIPEGKLNAVFDRFYSERPAGEDFGTHSGLGLAISKQIVEAHHGSIHAENRYDRDNRLHGARFIVDLPAELGGRG